MTIRVALHHETRYDYDRKITLGPQTVRLRPAYHTRTPVVAYDLTVSPGDHFCNWQQDPYANPAARLVFNTLTDHFSVKVDLIVDMTVINPFDFFVDEAADQYPFEYDEVLAYQLQPYLQKPKMTSALETWIDKLPKKEDRIIDWLVACNSAASSRVDYTIRMEPGVQTPTETLTLGSGSCRDSAWLMVESFRQMGVAARFVSGYLIQLVADQKSLDGPSGPEEDFVDLHAWVEVFLPGAGWVGLDPTSGLFAGEGHIPLACTPHYAGAAPISGGHDKAEVEFGHAMSVERVHEDPRVTKPFTEETWIKINEIGKQVDDRLSKGDVRLTTGGEPTFVSIDNVDDEQWNTGAVGEHKRERSAVLLKAVRQQTARGSLLHYGQGKWYPGEPLPRYAFTCLWRRDGEPIWQNDQYLADETKDYGHDREHSHSFINTLAGNLGLTGQTNFAVHEDALYFMQREQQLPIDLKSDEDKLDNADERSMVRRALTRGLSRPVGFVMPIERAWWQAKAGDPTSGWKTGQWPVRGERVYLIPGDSPIGLRLPLDSLPLAGRTASVFSSVPADPFSHRMPLPKPAPIKVQAGSLSQVLQSNTDDGRSESFDGPDTYEQTTQADMDEVPTAGIVRTALCVEAREGRVHVFMPPTQRLEDYLDLLTAVEQTATGLDLPVVVEGYLPPHDDRIDTFKITPDPGVIECNVNPTSTWDELVQQTTTLYTKAREHRLCAEKFDLDGRHTGTGGGAHVVMGGSTPGDSPFLRRPDLLASMVRFWNNHPSLSYLFSGKFIGPTSQAPRMDEARRDSVDEMEIALAQLDRQTDCDDIPPWLVDRLFRDLLVDGTGNTHRAEICVDKLYSPDSSTGRLGLVELRGFEMPPHEQLYLAQQLWIRAAIAAFWDKPYREPLVHWGTDLYDRFMLPHYVWKDFGEVVSTLRESGTPIETDWYAAQYEFRFPPIGEVVADDVHMKVRAGIEPWYVMAEDSAAGGTARYVDSSLERLEVLVDRFDPVKHAIVCNGVAVPMHPTGVVGQYVAGIKYRAWQPPRCLHPTIGIDTPLQIDVVDRSASHTMGGCRYHTSHPGGRSHETFPVNMYEAESRRGARFEAGTMTGGKIEIPNAPTPSRPSGYNVTLDLRRYGNK